MAWMLRSDNTDAFLGEVYGDAMPHQAAKATRGIRRASRHLTNPSRHNPEVGLMKQAGGGFPSSSGNEGPSPRHQAHRE